MNNKFEKTVELINREHVDAIAMVPSPNFFWLTGEDKHLMERPTTLLINAQGKAALVIAGFEVNSVKNLPIPFEAVPFDDNPCHWQDAFSKAGELLGLKGKKIGVEATHMRFQETEFLRNGIDSCRVEAANELFQQLRLNKTAEETSLMRKAAEIAQDALTETLKIVKPGVTENEIASELIIQLFRHGCDPVFPFSPIVAGGPNTADPHAAVSDRALQKGDFLLIDWGARYKGYCSDITRTFAIGEISGRQREIYETVKAANAAGRSAAAVGVRCGDIDKAARDVITAAGYGPYFTHRVGHGLGLEGHEDPYMFGENNQILEAGMSFTVEPGIYLIGDTGVRIEDDVTITEEGSISTTDFPRELRTL